MHKLTAITKRQKTTETLTPLIQTQTAPLICICAFLEPIEPNVCVCQEPLNISNNQPICVKQEDDTQEDNHPNQEALERYQARLALGCKNYIARHFFKNGELELKKNFPNL